LSACVNSYWGFSVDLPSDWYVWVPDDPSYACAYSNPQPFTGFTDEEAFEEAQLTIEVYTSEELDDTIIGFYEEYGTIVPGDGATLVYTPFGEFGAYGWLIPLYPGDANSPVLVIAGWGVLNDAIADFVDNIVLTIQLP